MKTYYELLELPATASLDEIKRAFRREIAKYHPDKVQHLGQEFQQMAVDRAAELTQAYKTLSDPGARADYDGLLQEGAAPVHTAPAAATSYPASAAPPRPAAAGPPETPHEPQRPGGSATFAQDRAGAHDLVLKATFARFRSALQGEFGSYEDGRQPGFDVSCFPKAAFWSLKPPPRVLGRFLPHVDAAALTESWTLAAKLKKDAQRDICVFVMGQSLAPAGELAKVIAEQRNKGLPAGGKVIMIPVNARTWQAHVPTDAPAVVKSLLTRLKSV